MSRRPVQERVLHEVRRVYPSPIDVRELQKRAQTGRARFDETLVDLEGAGLIHRTGRSIRAVPPSTGEGGAR